MCRCPSSGLSFSTLLYPRPPPGDKILKGRFTVLPKIHQILCELATSDEPICPAPFLASLPLGCDSPTHPPLPWLSHYPFPLPAVPFSRGWVFLLQIRLFLREAILDQWIDQNMKRKTLLFRTCPGPQNLGPGPHLLLLLLFTR